MDNFLQFSPGDFGDHQDSVLREGMKQATAGMPKHVVTRDITLVDFAREAWKIVEPANEYIHNWHIDAICDHLTAVHDGTIEQLVISMPPRHMKSLLVAVMWPCWVWTKNPGFKWVFSSYAQNLSTRDSVKCRSIIQSPWYQKHWGELYQLKRDENQKTKFTNTSEGYRIATSVNGSATGEGGDCIVGDDLLKAKDAYSDVSRKSATTFWRETMHTRLNTPKEPKKVLMAQRLHEADVTGAILSDGNYVHLCLPAEYDPQTFVVLPNCLPSPIGFEDPRTEPGDLLWPERYDAKAIALMKVTLGPWAYASQFQQVPTPAGGGIFDKDWWGRYSPATLPKDFEEVFMSWDMSFKKTTDGSYVVGQVWGKDQANFYLLDQVRDRWDFVETLREFKALCDRWDEAFAKYIEEKANGSAIISALSNEIIGLIPLNPKGSKEARAHAIAPAVRSGNVYIPDDSYNFPWVEGYISEHTSFPKGAHDDQVDATSQAIGEYIEDPMNALRIS